jgi:hypothetical protein
MDAQDLTIENHDDLAFEEIELPDADTVTLGNASYTKMLGRIYAA